MKTARLLPILLIIMTMLFSLPGPAPANGVGGKARLEALDGGFDWVGPSESLRPSGKNDALFQLELTAPGRTIIGIELKDPAGRYAVWDTFPGNRTWLLAVNRENQPLNRADGSVVIPLGQGREILEMRVEDNGAVKGGRAKFLVTVFFADGVRATFPVATGPAMQTGSTPAPASGYLVEVTAKDIFIDQGSSHGVKPGDRFTVLDAQGRGLATLTVRRAYGDVSLMALAQGQRSALAVGQRVARAPAAAAPAAPPVAAPMPASAPTPPPVIAPAPAPAATATGLKIGVLPAIMEAQGSLIGLSSDALPAEAVAKAINVYRPLAARAIAPAQAQELFSLEGAALQMAMERLGLDAIVKWGVSQQEYDERATVFAVLIRRQQVDDQETVSIMVDADRVPRRFGRLVTRLVGESLGYI